MSRTAKSATRSTSRKRLECASKQVSNSSAKSGASEVSIASRADVQGEGRSTKQERMLTLLSRPEGASVVEMMQATNWQQHSVRGFLVGTVKKKLGFSLTSSKASDDVRRYRIKGRRGR